MIQVLKAIGQSEDTTINSSLLYDCINQLITVINLISIPHSEPEMIDVFSALIRIDRDILLR
jgi:hypothetical protein